MGLGFFHNAIQYLSSAFARSGKSFKEASLYLKSFTTNFRDALGTVKSWKERKMFYRAEPFVAEMPRDLLVTQNFATPTPKFLTEKYQYLFRVKFRYDDKPLDNYEFLSFVSSEELTKKEAEYRMGNILLETRSANKYPNLHTIEMELRGALVSPWFP